jgi:hypothetical protein
MGFNRASEPIGQAAPWRGAGTDWPTSTGSGSAFVAGNIPGMSVLSSSVGPSSQTQWHPTILYLIAFVIAEMLIFHFLSNHLGL